MRPTIEIPIPTITALTRFDLDFFQEWANHYRQLGMWLPFVSWIDSFATEQKQLRSQADHEPFMIPLPAMTVAELADFLEGSHCFCRQTNTQTGFQFVEAVSLRAMCLASRILRDIPPGVIVQVQDEVGIDE